MEEHSQQPINDDVGEEQVQQPINDNAIEEQIQRHIKEDIAEEQLQQPISEKKESFIDRIKKRYVFRGHEAKANYLKLLQI
jgi:hypothetical protein